MTDKIRAQVSKTVVLISAATWVFLVIYPELLMIHVHNPTSPSGEFWASFYGLLAVDSFQAVAWCWTLMLVAMMLPILIAPISHVVGRSFRHRRARAVGLFLVGYFAVWIAAGGVLHIAIIALTLLAQNAYLLAIALAMIAIIWQCSPIKQRCLNRGHNHFELAAFGMPADRDSLRFGLLHGIWCVGSGWALMCFMMLTPAGHLTAMAAITFLMISERLEKPRPPSWQWRGPGKLWRGIATQIRMRRTVSPTREYG